MATFEGIKKRDKNETFDYHNFDSWSSLVTEPKIINNPKPKIKVVKKK